MPEKTSNKVKKAADKLLRTITNEEYNDESKRYRDRDSKKYTRGPHDDE
ncbi:hypothetical protein [Salinigranum halophilum]|nr:hypothetical protein [Salinigranum halophilum]